MALGLSGALCSTFHMVNTPSAEGVEKGLARTGWVSRLDGCELVLSV